MKKTIIAMLVFAFVAFGVFIVFGLNPPTPTVKAEGKEIAVGQGSCAGTESSIQDVWT